MSILNGYMRVLWLAVCLSSAVIASEINVGGNPSIIVTDGVNLYVSYGPYSFRNYISVISTIDNRVVKTIAVDDSPQFMIMNGTNLFLGFFDFVTMIDTKTLEKRRIDTPSLSAMMPIGTKLYVANKENNTVFVIDTQTNIRGKDIAVGQYPRAMASVGFDLYVANSLDRTVSVIDMATEETKASPIEVGAYPMAMLAYGNQVYVANTHGNTLTVIDTSTYQVKGLPIPVGREPRPMIVIENKLYVASCLGDYASVIDTLTDENVATLGVGHQPSSFAFANDKLYISNYVKGTISIREVIGCHK